MNRGGACSGGTNDALGDSGEYLVGLNFTDNKDRSVRLDETDVVEGIIEFLFGKGTGTRGIGLCTKGMGLK